MNTKLLFCVLVLHIFAVLSHGIDTRPSLDSGSGINKDHLLPETCGSIMENRVLGGKYAKLYEFPWMARIAYNKKDGARFQCSGTIINSKYILTTAHCIVNKNIVGVRVGDLDLSSDTDCEFEPGLSVVCENHIQDMRVELAIPHSEFRRMPPTNDIALLRIEGEIDFNHPNVKPICLPVTPELQNKVLDFKTGTVAGWGLTELGKLMKMDLPVKSHADCEMYIQNMSKIRRNETLKNQFCGEELGKDSCIGDAGCPFMIKDIYKDVNRYVQYGVVSYGPYSCGSGPEIYTDVSKYIKWILDNISD